ncbi:MAG: 30S ribosomal protein S18 [Rickettsiales bacterium]|jgi:small subunit ribosomal protein S18|nr:30S ribosomal protein S18 [Rickettsiales bacterium]
MVESNNSQTPTDGGFLKISLVNQGISLNTRRRNPLYGVKDSDIDYKNLKLLNEYISERGKIISCRISGVSMKQQRKISQAIKRARNLALLSFIGKNKEEK